jgi:hypothetical protein
MSSFTHPTFTLFPALKTKLRGCHFDTIEEIEAESQAVLNPFTEHDYQDAFKKFRKRCESSYVRKGTTARVMVVSMPKISF